MFDFWKKAMFTGIGLAYITKDKAEEIAKEFIQQGSITEQEGRKLVKEMLEYADKSKIEMEGWINKYIQKSMTKLELARKSDLEELRMIIIDLQQKIENLEKK